MDEPYEMRLGVLTTWMGTKVSPPYGIFLMAGLEEKIISDAKSNPLLWLQYLDGKCCIWTDGLGKLKWIFIYLNSFYPTIKLKANINFIDVSITKNRTKLWTDLFTKDTNSHQYLHTMSVLPST